MISLYARVLEEEGVTSEPFGKEKGSEGREGSNRKLGLRGSL